MRLLPAIDALWHVGVVHAPIATLLDADRVPNIAWLPRAPVHQYYADPFVLDERASELTLLCEAYDYAQRRGRIVEVRLRDDAAQVRTVYAPAHHVSFPCVTRHEGEVFCVVEQGATGRTVLHRFDERAGRFTDAHELLAGFGAADPVLFAHGGTFFLLATRHAERAPRELHIFHARALHGPYLRHPMSPIAAASGFARAAGAPFVVNGRLYRAVQDGRARYGGAVVIMEVVRCDEERFEERPVRELAPTDPTYTLGLHTLNAGRSVTVLDGLRASSVPPLARGVLGRLSRAGRR